MERVGPLLERKRLERGLSFAQIQEATGIKEEYARALEREAYETFRSEVEARSYLRVYARYLGLHLPEAQATFGGAESKVAPPSEMSSEEVLRVRAQQASPPAASPSTVFLPLTIALTFLLIVGLLALAYLILFYGG